MEIKKNEEELLSWDFPGFIFYATLLNGKLKKIRFTSKSTGTIPILEAYEGSENFLKNTHKALGELFAYLEKYKEQR